MLKWRKKVVAVGLLGALALTACGRGTVDSNAARRDPYTGKVDLVVNYNLTISEGSSQAMFSANFREENQWGPDIHLNYPASITVNGAPLSEDAVIDNPDGGELAAFYAGFVFPLFWVYMGDNGHVNYYRSFPVHTMNYTITFVDPEGESHTDTVFADGMSFSIPHRASLHDDLVISYGSVGIYDRVTCHMEYETISTRETIYIEEDGSERRVEEDVKVSNLESFPGIGGTVFIPRSALEDVTQQYVDIQCSGDFSKSLGSGLSGSINVNYVSRKQNVRLY